MMILILILIIIVIVIVIIIIIIIIIIIVTTIIIVSIIIKVFTIVDGLRSRVQSYYFNFIIANKSCNCCIIIMTTVHVTSKTIGKKNTAS